MEIIIGTSNPGKVREIASILTPLGYKFKPMSLDVDEIGETIQDNAVIKAVEYSKAVPGQYVIAEDSGLVVPNLNGLPGPYSSRFHTITLDAVDLKVINVPREVFTTDKTEMDKLNNERLVELVNERLSEDERGAYFEVSFVVAKDGEVLQMFTAAAMGLISGELRGDNGFGYDPLFIGNDTFGKTYAELDNARKNLRSHRKKALKNLGLWISQNISTDE